MSVTPLFHRLLLIEDNASHALLIRRALKDYVGDVMHVETLSAALKLNSLQEDFDIVLSDLNLPDTRGVSHISQLVSHFLNLPIMVLTSSTSLSDAVEAMRLGARDYLVKDFGNDFADVLGIALRRIARLREIEFERNKLRADMELLHFAIENSSDGLAVLKDSGELSWSNSSVREFLRLHGGQEKSLLDIDWNDFRKPETHAQEFRRVLLELPDGGLWSGELQVAGKELHAYALSLSRAERKLGEAEGAPQATKNPCVLWIRNVTDQRRRERFQREMLSTTTHDLKGPLGAVLTGAEIIEGMTSKGEKVHEIALRVHSAAQGILNMIEEFLSARRMQEGNFILRPAKHALAELCSPLEKSFATIAEARSIQLTWNYDRNAMSAPLDKLGFERVLGNLLSNALKFTPKAGSVTISIRGGLEGLHIEVRDTGQGMDAAEAKVLFERFARLAKHGDLPGTGLGLYVVRCIVEAHGGQVEVESSPGAGSLFRVNFPADPPINDKGELISLEFAGA